MAPPTNPSLRSQRRPNSPRAQNISRVSKPYSKYPQGRTPNILSKIRSIERKLRLTNKLSATVRRDLERELDSLNHEHAINKADDKRKDVMAKYKMVRFVESRKAVRAVKRAQKALDTAETEEQQTRLNRALHVAQIDLNYTLNYPMSQPYVGIYPKESEHLDQGRPRKGDPDMWDRVEKATADGTLVQLKNELVIRETAKTYPGGADVEMGDNDDGGSDGGFFE